MAREKSRQDLEQNAKMPQQLPAVFIMYGCHLVNCDVESQEYCSLEEPDLSFLAFSFAPICLDLFEEIRMP